MGIKKFLKPDKRKIVIFVIILVILYISSPFTFQPSVLFWFNPSFQLSGEIVYSFQSCIPADISPICSGFDYSGIAIMIISFLFWYLFSCLIYWVYEKSRGKKK
jgi:hypothetical protein